MINLLDHSIVSLQALLKEWGEPRFRAKQLVQWIHQRGVTDFDAMTDLSKSFRETLKREACVNTPEVALRQDAKDGTVKWLLKLDGGNMIEMVYIPERDRGTLCVSSQVGCALNCTFCSTGKEGFNRNLSLAEIIGQVWIAYHQVKVTNVVMMGMGEPLLNYDPVLDAMRLMLDDLAYGLSKYRVTLSTSGLLPQMAQLKADLPVALAVSLHAPTDELRNELVPINKKYPLKALMAVCRDYYAGQNKRKVTFEYVMLDGVNDQLAQAKALVRLVRDIPCKMNLIPFNPFPKTTYKRSTPQAIADFQQYLVDHGVDTWVRRPRGDDIDAACGQLAGRIQDRTGRHARWQKTGSVIPIKDKRQAGG